MAARLTKKSIDALAAKMSTASKPRSVAAGEVPGLALMLRPSGSHSWRLTYRPKGSDRSVPSRAVTIGAYPAISLDEARRQGRTLIGEIALGHDPAAAKRQHRADDRLSVAKALDMYEANLVRRKIINVKTSLSALRRGLKPYFADDVSGLTRKNIVKQINLLADAGRAGSAADLRKHARSFLEWAVNEGFVPHNPLAGLKMPRPSRHQKLEQEDANLRSLSDDEARRVWAASKDADSFGALVRLGLATGLRRGELSHLRWTDIKVDRITVAAARTKSGTAHEVPITTLSAFILAQVPRGVGPLVFPSSRRIGGATPLSGWTKLVARLARNAAVPDLKLHSLRRTFRTKLTEVGTPEHVAELTIGHQRQGLVKLYDHAELWKERAAAADAACQRIANVVGEDLDNVTPMRTSR